MYSYCYYYSPWCGVDRTQLKAVPRGLLVSDHQRSPRWSLSEGVSPRVCGLRLGAAQDPGWIVRTPRLVCPRGVDFLTAWRPGSKSKCLKKEGVGKKLVSLRSVGPLPRHCFGLGAHTPALRGSSRSHGPKSVWPVDVTPRKPQASVGEPLPVPETQLSPR